MITDFFRGISSYAKAIQLISKLKLWKYVLIPSLISLLLGGFVFVIAWNLSDDIGAWLVDFYPWEWGKSIVSKIADIFGGLLVLALGLIIFKQLVMIVSGSFMSSLSERVERALAGEISGSESNLKTAGFQIVRGVRISLRNLFWELFLTLILLIIGLFPLFSLFTTAAIFLIQSYYFGFGNLDFALERHLDYRGTVRFVKTHKSMAIGNGLITTFALMTLIGFAFILPIGVVAATIETSERM